ncbi:MAG: hypothetical protein K9M99_03745 [Candidatus Cloacimonetes bacterium]|nr:hypothetical protein [Candidatus Cloacimonadota bacterium]
MNRNKLPTELLLPCEIDMKDPFILKILDLFSFLFSKQNIRYDQVRLIMKLKLIQDRRKPSFAFKDFQPAKAKDSNMFLFSLLFFGLFGLMLLAFVASLSLISLLLGSVIFFTILMVFVSYAIILEFSLDFFDTSDQVILLSKPVGFTELNIAKSLHIFLYISAIATALALPSLVFWAIRINVFVSLIAFVFVILSVFFLLFCSALMYGLILGKLSGERLKDTISMVQIVSMIIIIIGSQLFVHTSMAWLIKLDITSIPVLLYLFPPTWFALPVYMVGNNAFSLTGSLVVLVGIFITFLGYRYYIYHQAPNFEKNLYKMRIEDKKQINRKKPIALKFSHLLKNNLHRAFYKFSVIMLTRERRLKMAIYPLMAMAFIYQAFFIYRMVTDPDIVIIDTNYFFTFYLVIAMTLPISIYTNFSEYCKASWIYSYLPLKTPNSIFLGANASVFICYQSVLLLIMSLLHLILWKFTIIPDMIIMLLNALIVQILYQHLSKRVLPFSKELKTAHNSAFQHFSYYLAVFVFIPLAFLLHYLVHTILPVLTIPLIPIQIAALYFLLKNHYNMSWNELQ